jgi:hypothetical protein
MKQFLVLFCLIPFIFCDADADPGYGYGRYGGHYHRKHYAPKCHVTYETVTSQACKTVTEPVCATKTVTNYITESKNECSTRSVQECNTVTRNVPEEQCATRTEQECRNIVTQVPDQECHTETEKQCTEVPQCTTEITEVPETTFVDECNDIVHQVCSETQVHVQAHANVIAHAAPALVNTVSTAGPLSAAIGVNTIPAAAGVPGALLPSATHVIAKREADADAQFLGLNAFPVGRLATGPAPLSPAAPIVAAPLASAPLAAAPLAAAPIATAPLAATPLATAPIAATPLTAAPIAATPLAAAPIVAAPRCQQKVDRQCRRVPVNSVRQVATPKCVSVPQCVAVPKTVCNPTTRDVASTVCNPKPVTECNTIVRQVPETVCNAKPVTECRAVPVQVPVATPVEECHPVAREVCHPVHKKVAHKHCSVHKSTPSYSYGHTAKVLSPVAVLSKSNSHHGHSKGTSYAYGVGKSFSRRDF